MSLEEYYNWEHEEFTTHSALAKYIEEIKPVLIGKPVRSIFIPVEDRDLGKTYICDNDIFEESKYNRIDSYVGGPLIIKIDTHYLLLSTDSGSYIEISLDKKLEINDEDMKYAECSFVFAQNVINQKIVDIYVTRAKDIDDFGLDFISKDCESDDMFKNLVIKLENGYKLLFRVLYDFYELVETKEDDYLHEYKVIYCRDKDVNSK